MKKEKSVEEVIDEFAKKLLVSLKQGRHLVLLCSNSAPPMRTKFAAPRFPFELFDAAKVQPALQEGADLDSTIFGPLLAWKKEQGINDPSHNVVVGHPNFRVVVVTKFDAADYRGFLEDEWPMERLQPIKVFTHHS